MSMPATSTKTTKLGKNAAFMRVYARSGAEHITFASHTNWA